MKILWWIVGVRDKREYNKNEKNSGSIGIILIMNKMRENIL